MRLKFWTALTLMTTVFIFNQMAVFAQSDYDAEMGQLKRVQKQLQAELPKDWFYQLGSMHQLLGVEPVKCAMLARVLGVKRPKGRSFRAPISRSEALKLSEHLADEGAEFALLLVNRWIEYEKTFSSRPRKDNVEHWNLECVGQFPEISRAAYIRDPLTAAEFQVGRCMTLSEGKCLQVLGPFELGFYQRFRKIILEQNIKFVELGSGGGSVSDALAAGRLMRRRGIATGLHSNCFSACSLAFLGGRRRAINAPQVAKLGFHQVSRGGRAVPKDDPVYQDIRRYCRDMGANPNSVIRFMMKASPADMHYPDFTELCPSGVTSYVYQMCRSK